MCGVSCFWAKEAVLSEDQYDILLRGASFRGGNGIGVGIYNSTQSKPFVFRKFTNSYSKCRDEILKFISNEMKIGSILFIASRATPETELETTEDMLQPIYNQDLILIHNGGVTDSIKREIAFSYIYSTDIDSEAILAAYRLKNNNMKSTMEYLVGSFAFVMLDIAKDKLYAVTSFNPLAHMYIRGYGYFLHSDNTILGDVLKSLTGQDQDGVNVWESWYRHYLSNYTIIETDLQSGFQFKQYYSPRFLHPTWNSLEDKGRVKTLVVASGGVDSGLTAAVLKSVGHDVEIVHFLYGQKAEECEKWAVEQIGKHYNVPVRIIDLRFLYKDEKSMLLSNDVEITTGGDLLKSTIAWTAGRNAIFATIAMTIAEQLIVSNQCDHVNISAGWSQLSEETSGYCDNSFAFNECLEQFRMVGYITGARIKFLPVMQRILKTEEWILGNILDFPFQLTVSCDEPEMINGYPRLCVECGSTKLSILAADRAGVIDLRKFLTPRPKLSQIMDTLDIMLIIDRLILTEKEKTILRERV